MFDLSNIYDKHTSDEIDKFLLSQEVVVVCEVCDVEMSQDKLESEGENQYCPFCKNAIDG